MDPKYFCYSLRSLRGFLPEQLIVLTPLLNDDKMVSQTYFPAVVKALVDSVVDGVTEGIPSRPEENPTKPTEDVTEPAAKRRKTVV